MSIIRSTIFRYVLPALFIAAGTVFFAARAYLTDQPSVLYRHKDSAAVDPADGLFVLWNPFRDRMPEAEADGLLADLKNGVCGKITPELALDCEREAAYPPQTWELADREETATHTRLHYRIYRKDHDGASSNGWLELQRSDGQWRTVSVEFWY